MDFGLSNSKEGFVFYFLEVIVKVYHSNVLLVHVETVNRCQYLDQWLNQLSHFYEI